ncbi:hypothetical protein [Streptomyces sp. A1136]|uniref:DUF6197 family protein n=1 Tax=Streptomyces sp. A1136 TaxID=2563102 RepID=UPI00109E9C69|nr:hypothetical protein [Streptomyces sp. A1136]THA47486.1 hypothetical protein E6R62_31235 [Streptomyces sp. A1136]
MTALLLSDALVEQTRRQLLERDVWYGLSGLLVTGESVARHLTAAAGLMERKGWDPQLYAPFSGHHLRDALTSTRDDGMGDADTQFVARAVLEAILRLATGAPYVDYEVWSEHPVRTLDEVLAACRTASALALQHGPGPGQADGKALDAGER